MPYEFTQVEEHIVRVSHRGPVTRADGRQLRAYLRTVDDNLLIDLTGSPVRELARQLCAMRPMLPRTACYGPPLPEYLYRGLPGKDYYLHEVRHFETQDEALAWLREEPPRHRQRDRAAIESSVVSAAV
jgi:hypothetical protein